MTRHTFKHPATELSCSATIPFDHDEAEPDVIVFFDFDAPEPMTRDYPGSPGGVYINRVVYDRENGGEIDLDGISPDLMKHFEDVAIEYLRERDERY